MTAGAPPSTRRVTILDSTVDLQTLDQVVQRLGSWIDAPGDVCRRVVVTGYHGLWEASKDPELRGILNTADLWVPDGIAPVWIARMRGHRNAQRIPGAELMAAVFEAGAERGYRHFFYGDTTPVLDALGARIESRWPGNVVAGAISPPFRELTPDETQAHLDEINRATPDILWVGLGMPKQDVWIHRHQDALRVPIATGVGAAFAFVAGTVDRAPDWVGRAGLEWLYRLVKEPRKCWHRSLVEGPRFVRAVFHEQARLRRRR